MNALPPRSGLGSDIQRLLDNRIGLVLLGLVMGGAVGSGALPKLQQMLGIGTTAQIQEVLDEQRRVKKELVERVVESDRRITGVEMKIVQLDEHVDTLYRVIRRHNLMQ